MQEQPQSIGPYRILEPLGRGGMGVIYRCEHRKTGAIAALKTVPLPHESLLQGIRREIHTLSRIRHPGIVRILDEGVADGLPWYAMELLEGQPLGRARAEVPALGSALTLVRRLCAPLAYLHGEGIVHRDLKPANILVRPDSQPVLLDFGLVSRFSADLSREALELAGSVSGTVEYMAPEQLLGEMVDARADLYSLGCILYELLAGHPPFEGFGAAQVAQGHFKAQPRAPSELRDGVPPQLDALVLQLLAKRPQDRLGHALDVAAALARLGAEEEPDPDAPRPRSYLYRPALAGRSDAMDACSSSWRASRRHPRRSRSRPSSLRALTLSAAGRAASAR